MVFVKDLQAFLILAMSCYVLPMSDYLLLIASFNVFLGFPLGNLLPQSLGFTFTRPSSLFHSFQDDQTIAVFYFVKTPLCF